MCPLSSLLIGPIVAYPAKQLRVKEKELKETKNRVNPKKKIKLKIGKKLEKYKAI